MRYRVLVVVAFVVATCASTSLALTRMGAPAGSVGPRRWDIGLDYTFARQNVDWKNPKVTGGILNTRYEDGGTIEGMKMQTAAARIGLRVIDGWDIYGIIGGMQLKSDDTSAICYDGETFTSATKSMYGLGTRFTFWEDGALKLGALGQVCWANDLNASNKHRDVNWKTDIGNDITETQIAVGPAYQITEGISVYGGPFAHLLSGEVDLKESTMSGGSAVELKSDLEQSSWFGLYAGAEFMLTKRISANIEYQHTAFADAGGVNFTLRF